MFDVIGALKQARMVADTRAAKAGTLIPKRAAAPASAAGTEISFGFDVDAACRADVGTAGGESFEARADSMLQNLLANKFREATEIAVTARRTSFGSNSRRARRQCREATEIANTARRTSLGCSSSQAKETAESTKARAEADVAAEARAAEKTRLSAETAGKRREETALDVQQDWLAHIVEDAPDWQKQGVTAVERGASTAYTYTYASHADVDNPAPARATRTALRGGKERNRQ